MTKSVSKQNTRNRKYLLTINNPADHNENHESILEKLKKYKTEYIAMCDETGSQGTFHTHVYVKYINAVQFNTIKKLFPTANIQSAQGNSLQNRNYILKNSSEHNKKEDGSYEYTDSTGKKHSGVNHSESFLEFGICPKEEQGKRNDLVYLYELVKDGYNNAEILEKIPETAVMHIDKINKIRLSILTEKYKGNRRLDLKVNYITGKTGAGKSRDILDEWGDENVYRITDYQHPFDSYQCEPVIVFEEFRSSLRLQDMLNYLDIYPCILPARYASKVACYSTVYVVSNWNFEQQYSELQKDVEQKTTYDAWVRRFNGNVKDYTKNGIVVYPTMKEYLSRYNNFQPVEEPTPFDVDADVSIDSDMPFS